MMTTQTATIDMDPETKRALGLFAARIAAKFDVIDLVLFGSRARGEYRQDSDADVAVLLRGEHQRLLPTKLTMADEAFDVLLETGIRIQPLPIWEDQWSHPELFPNPRLIRAIVREGLHL